MPDIMSHILMGYDVINNLPSSNSFKQAAANHSGLFNDGLQGPDPFFYLENFPWGKHSLKNIGNLMHKEKTGVFLLDLIESLGNLGNCPEMKASCLCGLICHYCLDTICHPYIFYFSGFDYSGNNPKYSVCHKKFETILDMLLVRQMVKEPSRFITRADFLETSEDVHCAYEDFSKEILLLYGKSISTAMCLKSLRYMKYSLKVLHDPIGLKRPLILLSDSIFRTHGMYSATVYDYKKIKSIDYANISHETWKHPVTGEASTDSFFDLYEKAAANAVKLISAADDYLNGKFDKSELQGLFPDLDYNTGLKGDDPMVFHKCLFD